jgi:hypothetical protein
MKLKDALEVVNTSLKGKDGKPLRALAVGYGFNFKSEAIAFCVTADGKFAGYNAKHLVAAEVYDMAELEKEEAAKMAEKAQLEANAKKAQENAAKAAKEAKAAAAALKDAEQGTTEEV